MRELSIDPEKAIGLRVSMNDRKGEIVGVVKDFHFAPLHKKIGPLVLFNQESDYNNIFIKLKSGNITESVSSIKKIYNQLVSHRPFEYHFIDQQYSSLYNNEQRMAKINTVFSVLAIVIACLGLLGLSIIFCGSEGQRDWDTQSTGRNRIKHCVVDHQRLYPPGGHCPGYWLSSCVLDNG